MTKSDSLYSKRKFKKIKLDKLPPNEDIVGPDPDANFVKSVESMGVFNPIFVQEDGDLYNIIAGRRRVKAARIVGDKTIDSLVYPAEFDETDIIALHENEQRKDNLAVTYQLVSGLFKDGFEAAEIAGIISKPITRVREIMKLDLLPKQLMVALRKDEIRTSVALRVTKLDAGDRQKATKLFKENGRLTNQDVGSIRSCTAADLASAMPDYVFDVPSPDVAGSEVELKSDLSESHFVKVMQGILDDWPDETYSLASSVIEKIVDKAGITLWN